MNTKKHDLKLIKVVIMAAFLTGCSTITQNNRFSTFEKYLEEGEVHQASGFAIEEADVDPETGQPDNLLWSLQAGATLRAQGSYDISNQFFDYSEALIKTENTKNTVVQVAGQAGSLLVNDAALDYQPAVYDGIMANTYKALNFMTTGNMSYARIEWNRVDDRQRRAADHFSRQIQNLKEEQDKESQEYKKQVAHSLKDSKAILAKKWQR